MARSLKNCFIFGRIGVRPARLVFGETEPPPAPPPQPEAQNAPEKKEAPGAVLDRDVAEANNKLQTAIAEVTKQIEAILKDDNASPAKKAAAEKARAALEAMKGKNQANEAKQQTLNEVRVILDYHLQSQEAEVKVAECRTLLNQKFPWINSEEANFNKRAESLKAMGVNEQLIARLTSIHNERRQIQYNLISRKFPKITGKEQVTLAMFAANPNAFNEFLAGIGAEKDALSNPATLAELAKTKEEAEAGTITAINEFNADVRLDVGRSPDSTVKQIEAQYEKYKGRWEKHAKATEGVNLDAALAKVQSLCLEARTKAQQAGGANPALERAMLLASLEDDLNAHYYGKENDRANLSETEKRAGGASSLAQTPGLTREVQGRIDRLGNEELKALVAGAPGEYRDALLKIAESGEKQGERVSFKLLFNKTFYDCDFFKEAPGVYRIKMLDPATNKVEPVATYKSKEDAMRQLKDGVVTQRLVMRALGNPEYYKHYEKQGVIDLKGDPPQVNEKGEVTFRLDWKGVSDVTGNPIVTARAMPNGMIFYTVNRNGVGFRGENTRSGLASSVGDFFRQLEHLQKWSENFKEFAGRPGWDRSPEMLRELNYFSLNNPANFYQHEARIGRPVYFGVSPKTVDRSRGYEGDVDMILDWGGGPTNDREQNPYIRMKLQPNGTINYAIEYKGRRADVNNAPNVAAVIEGLAYYRATIYKPAEVASGPAAPGAGPAQAAGTPGTAAEQGAPQTPGSAPQVQAGGPAVAPAVSAGAPAVALGGAPQVPAGGPAAAPESAKTPAGEAAKRAVEAKNTAEAAKKRVAEIVNGAKGKQEDEVNKAITEARAEAEKAKNAAEEAKKAVDEAKKAVEAQLKKAEEAKKTADKADADKAPNNNSLRTQSQAETTRLGEANKALKQAEEAAAAADKAATEASAKAATLKAPETPPPAAPATAPA